jgi:hypothetical protein
MPAVGAVDPRLRGDDGRGRVALAENELVALLSIGRRGGSAPARGSAAAMFRRVVGRWLFLR